MADESPNELHARIRAASDAAQGLDMDALRRKRDAMRDHTALVILSVDVAALWPSPRARYRPRGTQTAAIRGDAPEERDVTRINTASNTVSNRRDSSDD